MKFSTRTTLGIGFLLCIALSSFGQSKAATSGAKSSTHASTVAGEITVAAASDVAPALEPIIAEFRKAQGGNVKATYGAPGALATQIEQGAPFDAFLSADLGYPKRLIDKKLADAKTLTTYTRGRLVLYVLPAVPVDVTHAGLSALTNDGIKKIAIANPETSPYGRAAVAALKKAGIYEKVQPKLQMADSVAKAAQAVRSGSAEAAIIALSFMHDPQLRRHGRVVEVDMNDYPPLDESAVVLKHGANNPLAAAFVEYLNSQMAQGLFVRYGFMPSTSHKDAGGPASQAKSDAKTKAVKKPATPKR